MFVSKRIQAEHKDLIHDVAFDFYGKRFATCSSDQSVKVWDIGEDGQWQCSSTWKTHSGSVWKVTWAHPEFGQILATCSFDKTAAIWEELGPEGSGGEHTQSQWVKKTSLVDSRTPVTDVKFAPKHLGLQLATCSSDGTVRIYEAPDIMNVSQWSLQYEVSCKISCSCLAWSSIRSHPSLIAVGSDDPSPTSGVKFFLYEYNENNRRWQRLESINVSDPIHDLAFAPAIGRNYHTLAIATKNVQIVSLKPVMEMNASLHDCLPNLECRKVAEFEHHNSQVWRVSWNISGTVLASSGDDGSVRLWKANYLGKWRCAAVLKGDGTSDSTYNEDGLNGESNMIDLLGTISSMQLPRFGPSYSRPLH